MGIVHEDKGRNEEAADAFRKAIAQLSDTEPILYELLGRNLERLERWKEAVAAYEKYLELAPTGAHASAINSIIDQLRKQAAEQSKGSRRRSNGARSQKPELVCREDEEEGHDEEGRQPRILAHRALAVFVHVSLPIKLLDAREESRTAFIVMCSERRVKG
jgi:tetratricopeptide (TPR) repeat protein